MNGKWLMNMVQRAGISGAEDYTPAAGATDEELWEGFADTCNLTEFELLECLADQSRLPLADLTSAESSVLRLIPEKIARQYIVFPLRESDTDITIATSGPGNPNLEKIVRFTTGRNPVFELASPHALNDAIDAHYSPNQVVDDLLVHYLDAGDSVSLVDDEEVDTIGPEDVKEGPVIKLTNHIIFEGISRGASDIHLEPGRSGGVVRFRVDGVLNHYMQMPMTAMNRVVSRIKIMSKLDISNRLRPQDGKAQLKVAGRKYDFRVSTVPTRKAEKIVIRILDTQGFTSLDSTGIPAAELKRFRRLLLNRESILFVTGPTGSGKTTTFYGALCELATGEVNIITVEDPVEYELEGITQIQVEEAQGVTFASALRAILRQDPDIVMIGEIRDSETAEIAVQASLTGHLVMATLHTNDSIGIINRLSDLGINRTMIAEAVKGTLSQRLLRRLCEKCAEQIGPEDLNENEKDLVERYGMIPKLRAVGCRECGNSGFRGRVPAIELWETTPEIESLIIANASLSQIRKAARASGMKTLLEAGLDLVREGTTSLDEIDRMLGDDKKRTEKETDAVPESPADDAVHGVPHILLVDDDKVIRTMARIVLQKSGFEVTEASDGTEAIEILKQPDPYDLLVLDLDMPKMRGDEVLKQVRASMSTAGLPVIFLTGSDQADTEVELMEAGADDYIRKPMHPDRFLARVKATLRRSGADHT